jgi:hypothetical protein
MTALPKSINAPAKREFLLSLLCRHTRKSRFSQHIRRATLLPSFKFSRRTVAITAVLVAGQDDLNAHGDPLDAGLQALIPRSPTTYQCRRAGKNKITPVLIATHDR